MKSLDPRSNHAARLAIVLCCVVAVVIGYRLWNRMADHANGYLGRSDNVDHQSYNAIWDVRSSPARLVHLVIKPDGAVSGGASSVGLGHQPIDEGISSFPDGLYVDAQRIPVGEGRRVFVWTEERKLRPIPLTSRELAALGPVAIDHLETTEVWKNKIQPVLEEENWWDPGGRVDGRAGAEEHDETLADMAGDAAESSRFRPPRPAPVQAPFPRINGPKVALLSRPDLVATEQIFRSDDAKLIITRTGPTDERLVVDLAVTGSATKNDDYAYWHDHVTIPAGKSSQDISVVIYNDQLIEGNETVELILEPSPDYEVAGKPLTVVIHDNDHWQWAKHSGKDIPKTRIPMRRGVPGLDYAGQSPAWASMDCILDISNDSVTAKYTGKFFDGGYISDESRSIGDSIEMEFDFDPVTGEIFLSKLKGRSRVKRSGELVGGLGAYYVADNDGPGFRHVTVTVSLAVYVPGEITITGGPQVVGKNSPASTPFTMTRKGTGSDWGTAFHTTMIFTLKLEAVEDKD